jgi:hypothetical protein
MKRNIVLLAFVSLLLAFSCAPPDYPPDAICMTKSSFDAQVNKAYSEGYQKAKSEQPQRADVELTLITHEKLLKFLKADFCDRCLSSVTGEASDACLDRAECLTSSLRKAGYDSYGVVLNFSEGYTHAIVAVPTKDKGLVFIEPWYDQEVTVKLGYNYMANFPKQPGTRTIEKLGILY